MLTVHTMNYLTKGTVTCDQASLFFKGTNKDDLGNKSDVTSGHGMLQIVFLGPDYMSRAGPVSRAASVCRDDFLPGIT